MGIAQSNGHASDNGADELSLEGAEKDERRSSLLRTNSILIKPQRDPMPLSAESSSLSRAPTRMSTFRSDLIASERNPLGILVHGCHLEADNWEEIVWGVPPMQLGRLPHAALLAWEERQHLVCLSIGTGASCTSTGELEGAYMLRMLFERFPRLTEFSAFEDVPIAKLEALLKRTASAETVSQNTTEEVREGFKIFEKAGCKRAVLVSSPTHLPRCLACACSVEESEPDLFSGSVWASPCDTSYADANAADVVVVEPPHRGDRDKELDTLPFHKMVKRSFRVPSDQRAQFLQRFDDLLKDYGV
eukprot:TRINITY_DN48473_c0_g1_i1.p1 TRINITY_DN48473_c0_g1~~TRINITY_DN48473_c0_g1_i1.p1  ORF type:complete len:304 (+),score=44.45 TRINITY_DN48473_c0_g1_i1:48-959(+)